MLIVYFFRKKNKKVSKKMTYELFYLYMQKYKTVKRIT